LFNQSWMGIEMITEVGKVTAETKGSTQSPAESAVKPNRI